MNGDLFEPPRNPRPRRAPVTDNSAGWSRDAAQPQVYSVAEVNALAKNLIETALPPLWIQGEVTSWKRHASGHCYFALKDKYAQVRAVMFRTDAQRLPADPGDGMEVRVLGTLTLYEKRGEFQLVVRELEAKGAGGLWRVAFERLRAKLDAEGALAPARKRQIPQHPRTIGVVTSPVGAVLHDILQVVQRRAPWTRIVFSPAKVQGDGAAHDIARALYMFCEQDDVELVIVGRGGGSTEDLWCFNDEVVARAILNCPVPVISAVGHETDVTIADLVADLRAPTPSAAAEHAVPDGALVRRDLAVAETRLTNALRRGVSLRRERLVHMRKRLESSMRDTVQHEKRRLAHAGEKLDALSPLGALARGFAVPRSPSKKVLRRRKDFVQGDPFELRVADGTIDCRVEDVKND